MFDVCWTDPNRELLSEKVARKEIEEKHRIKRKSENGRQSFSTASSSSSDIAERTLGFFSSIRGRKAPSASRPRDSTLKTDFLQEESTGRRSSIYGVKSILSHIDNSEVTMKPPEGASMATRSLEIVDVASSVSSRGNHITLSLMALEDCAK